MVTAAPDDPLARAQARVGSVLDEKWRLEELIGLGGMAAVYAGRHRNGARGAVKILHPEHARVREVRERFLREGYAANKVEHPGAVKVLDDDTVRSGPDEGTAYLIMELLDGQSIEERIHARGLPFPIDEVLAIADDVLDVLVAAHDKGVIHRDLKPENLFLHLGDSPGPFGFQRVKVVDFGLARLLSHTMQGEGVTRAGMAIGTPSYMAPEQAEGRSELIDGRSDLFGLGAIMFRLIAARRVHEANNVVELVTKMAHVPAPPLRSVRADAPAAVAMIVDRALSFDREGRYPNALAMREDVRAAREGRPLPSQVDVRSLFGTEPTIAETSEIRAQRRETETSGPATIPAKSTARPGHRRWWWTGVVVGVCVATSLVFALSRRSRVTTEPASSPIAPMSEPPRLEPMTAPAPTPSPSPLLDPVVEPVVEPEAVDAAPPDPPKPAAKPTSTSPRPKTHVPLKKLSPKKKK